MSFWKLINLHKRYKITRDMNSQRVIKTSYKEVPEGGS